MNKPIKLLSLFLIVNSLLLYSTNCSANMASPLKAGSKNASAFSSKDVNILYERIVVHLSKDFKTAKYSIEYTINSSVVGGQIPLLFLAKDYKNDFKVWMDNKLVNIQEIPNYINTAENTPFANFTQSFQDVVDSNKYMNITWMRNENNQYNIDDLKYFEANVQKGEHKINIEYEANVWVNQQEWVNEYSFRYSLAPAKYWKSFGGLTITIIQSDSTKIISTNLNTPIEGKIGLVSNWKFSSLPADLFIIEYHPTIHSIAKWLIAIEPFGIMLIVGILLFGLHFLLIVKYNRIWSTKPMFLLTILGSFLIPYLMLHSYFISYNIIDSLIGEVASKRHGYYFLILFWYPIIVALHLLLIWLFKYLFVRKP